MKLYLVVETHWDYYKIWGAFSTSDKANQAAKFLKNTEKLLLPDSSISIEEFQLDPTNEQLE